MLPSWSSLIGGRSASDLLQDLLGRLKGLGLAPDDWEPGAAIRVVLETALSPALSTLWDAVAAVTQGGLLRLAQGLAEADPQGWADNAQGSWLVLLAQQLYGVQIKLAGFTQGLLKFVNTSGSAYTVSTAVVASLGGFRYQVTTSTPLPAGATRYIPVQAVSPGAAYNISSGLPLTLNVSMPGVVVTTDYAAPAVTWITLAGWDQETPKQLADRCAARWARLSVLQAAPADAYISLAEDAAGAVKKVAVWSNFSPNLPPPGFEANSVTLYLGTDSGPCDAPTVAAVDAAVRPYIGLHDKLYTRPCGAATYNAAGTVYVSDAALIPTVQAAIETARAAYQAELQIGQTVHAWRIRKMVGVPGVTNFIDTLVDLVPAKNALITINTAGLTYAVGL